MADEFKKSDLQILVSTMNRSNLDFLIPMFPFSHFSNFSILIINQTSPEKLLVSDFPSIKVINSFEIGLSKSRNYAIKNAEKPICLIADDDVIYEPNFDQKIIQAYNQNSDADLICFKTKTFEDKAFSNYKEAKFWMNLKDAFWVLSIEITFKTKKIKEQNIVFNEHFGLGAKFQDSESYYFLRRANYHQLKMLFFPDYIVVHDKISSSDEVTSDRWLYAKTAGFYKRYKSLSYLLVFKIIFFLLRKKFISYIEIKHKLHVGFKGIRDYKVMIKNKSEDYYD